MSTKKLTELNFSEIIPRLKKEFGVKKNKELAILLGFNTDAALSDRIKRNSIPLDKIKAIALEKSRNLDYILTGENKELGTESANNEKVNNVSEPPKTIDNLIVDSYAEFIREKGLEPEFESFCERKLKDQLKKKLHKSAQ